MTEENKKLTMKGMREADFLKKFAQRRSEVNRDEKLENACRDLNKDVRDAFCVAGTSKEGDRTFLHIVTSGKEGEEQAKKTLRELSQAGNIDVKNRTAERFDENKPSAMKEFMEYLEKHGKQLGLEE